MYMVMDEKLTNIKRLNKPKPPFPNESTAGRQAYTLHTHSYFKIDEERGERETKRKSIHEENNQN